MTRHQEKRFSTGSVLDSQGVALRKLSSNGTITNVKFCLSRHVRLHLSHWRLAQRSQQAVTARLSYPCDRDESRLRHRGGSNEETSMDMPPSASRADGSSAPLGYSLLVASRDGALLNKRSSPDRRDQMRIAVSVRVSGIVKCRHKPSSSNWSDSRGIVRSRDGSGRK